MYGIASIDGLSSTVIIEVSSELKQENPKHETKRRRKIKMLGESLDERETQNSLGIHTVKCTLFDANEVW